MVKETTENNSIQALLKKRKIRFKQLEKELENTSKYISFAKKEERIFKKFELLLNDELKEILIAYIEIVKKIISFQSEFYYDGGFNDCAELVMTLKENYERK